MQNECLLTMPQIIPQLVFSITWDALILRPLLFESFIENMIFVFYQMLRWCFVNVSRVLAQDQLCEAYNRLVDFCLSAWTAQMRQKVPGGGC